MSLIDFILNMAGLLIWLNWRAAAAPAPKLPGAPLLSNIRPAGPLPPGFYQWISLPILLVARAVFYRMAGPPVRWNPPLLLGPTILSFRSDFFGRMLLFSILSFAASLGVCYVWLLFLSAVNQKEPEADPIQRLTASWLGMLQRWPLALKLFAPVGLAAVGWLVLHPLLAWLKMVPSNDALRLLAQGADIGAFAFVTLKYLIVGLMVLYVLNSYIYMGEFALWHFVTVTSRRLLTPWRPIPLRAGRFDFAPTLTALIVWFGATFAQRGLIMLYHRLL